MTSSTIFSIDQGLAALADPSSPTSEEYAISVKPSSKEPEMIESVEVVAPPLNDSEANPPIVTKAMHRKGSIQLAVLCMGNFVCGWNLSIVGPLVPRVLEVYHVGYSVLSISLFMFTVGDVFGSAIFVHLMDRFGFGVMTVTGSILVAIGNALQASTAPFPVFVVGSFLTGVGVAFLGIGSTAFIASQAGNRMTKMMILSAMNNVGSVCAPLAATQFARLPRWSLVYTVNITFAFITAIFQVLTFRFKSHQECLKEIGQPPLEKTEDSLKGVSKYKQILRLPSVHLMAFFVFVFSSVPTVILSWIVTFMVKERHGGPNSGYVSSGFSGGIAIGPLALIPLSKTLGAWRVMFLYILLILGLELVVWLVPSFVVNAVSISFVGFFLGPISPLVTNHIRCTVAPELIAGAISWISGIAPGVGALVSVLVSGAIASRTSIDNLHPLLIAMLGLMLIIWAFVPRHRARLA